MNVIALSKKKFSELAPLELSKEVFNTEGVIYDFNYRGKEKVLKTLHHLSGRRFANKLYTLEMLDTYSRYLPNSFLIPDNLASVNGSVCGFTVPKKEGVNLSVILKNRAVLPQEQIYYLKRVGEILHQMASIRKYTPLNSIFLNDLHESNFIVEPDKKDLTVIDLDSCKIASNDPFDSRFLTPFALLNNAKKKYQISKDDSMGYVIADENSDLYCYNMMILNYLYGESVNDMDISDFYAYLNYLSSLGVSDSLIDSFDRLTIDKDNINPASYLDTISSEQICRASKVVYKKMRKQ